MGKKMLDIYEAIKQEGGIRAQMRLAMLTGLASPQAAKADDSPEMLKKFAAAYKEITSKDCPVAFIGGIR